ncbi:hypothetical protein V1514DRAFT_323781 [Lipomyces japonicus]|uniref:uncharacterized protein n=1 Tax=Lipomyces japonicus TaxID=56871 RepID=UPI0034CE427B
MENPTEQDVTRSVNIIKQADPNLGIAKVHVKVKDLHPSWALSLARLKAIVKSSSSSSSGANTNVPESVRQRLYVHKTRSSPVADLDLPDTVAVVVTADKGKTLTATHAVPAGMQLWTEQALVTIPPAQSIPGMQSGRACSYCGRPCATTTTATAACDSCNGRWCTIRCKKLDRLHRHVRHGNYQAAWRAVEQFAVAEQWAAFHRLATCLAWRSLASGDGDLIGRGLDGMATIRQDERQRIADPMYSSNMFAGEQFEIMWQAGYELLATFLQKVNDDDINNKKKKEKEKDGKDNNTFTYEQYMEGIGMVNLNNLDGNLYLVQSHLNHSCEPNLDVKVLGPTVGIRVNAKRAIAAGEELTTTYVDPSKSLPDRRQQLLESWGFWCTCARCVREDAGLPAPDLLTPARSDPSTSTTTTTTTTTTTKKKKAKNGKKKKVEPMAEERTRKKSVTFNDTVIRIEI